MAEYIEREAALRVLCDACGNAACPKGLIPRCSYYEKMQSIPAADVRPMVRGKWTRIDYEPLGHDYKCSACGWKNDMRTHYCPNCGAMMEES